MRLEHEDVAAIRATVANLASARHRHAERF
jgi:hypothetical protein